MEKLEFTIAKNGEKTCKIGSTFLHSSYNPRAEAQKFVASIQCDFYPHFILIAEPCISYCVPFLRQRFPKSRIIAIRYSPLFSEYNSLFDGVAFIFNNDGIFQFENQILSLTGEDGLCSSLFLSWKAACSIFQEQDILAWHSIKRLAIKSRAILFTKERFSKRWITNSIQFVKNTHTMLITKKINTPIVIAASGPSLKTALPYLKKFRESYFLLCVSSATSVLLHQNIKPDLVISTDGGYWAKEHLFPLLKNTDVPLAISAESACSKNILRKNPIIPLFYSDGFESEIARIFTEETGGKYTQAARNGTVSGTAVEFALSLTSKNVFACGLDLSPSNTYQHTQPNALEKNAALFDCKIKNLETRQIAAMINSMESLEIYKNWFAENASRFENRFFRLSNNFQYKNTLGTIRTVDFSFFEKNVANSPKKETAFDEVTVNSEDRKKALTKIKKFILQNSKSEKWQKYAFPCDFLLYEKCFEENKKQSLYTEILKKNTAFVKKITEMCENCNYGDL
ncbi:MAG: DUF115 domain-containing protein [Treponema sp.]|nr:DUF115 domain-containing protein [Treponema sp.]